MVIAIFAGTKNSLCNFYEQQGLLYLYADINCMKPSSFKQIWSQYETV